MKIWSSLAIIPIALLSLTGIGYGQGLNFTSDQDYALIPKYQPNRTIAVFSREVDGNIVYETKIVDGPLPNLPPSHDLTKYAPVPKSQEFNDCVGWAVGYCALTTQIAQARSTSTPNNPVDIFSARFIYSQIHTGSDNGSWIYRSDPNAQSAVSLVLSKGCSSEATAPYISKFADSEGWSRVPSARSYSEAKNYICYRHAKCETLDDIRYALVFGIPVVISVWYESQMSALNGSETYDWNGGKQGGHAMCIVGYDNSRQQFLVQNSWGTNSWGTNWGIGGRIWVDYKHFTKLDSPQRVDAWCRDAHAIIASDLQATQMRNTITPSRSFYLFPDGAVQKVGDANYLLPSGSLRFGVTTSHFLYGLKSDGAIIGLDEQLNWHNITSDRFPDGFGGGKAKMIAASNDYLYAITELGSVLGRVPLKLSATGRSYWEKINLPINETPVDIRVREGIVYVTSADGDVFRRIPGDGGQPGSWVLEN